VESVGRSVRSRRRVACAAAVAVAAADLAHELSTPALFHHPRSPAALALMAAVALVLVVVVPRYPTILVAIGAGIAAGGAVGNLVSALVWAEGVPDPLVLRAARGGVAFNLADISLVVGDGLLLCAAVVFALRNRERLRERL
jgi:lipoprotein signal peptidase